MEGPYRNIERQIEETSAQAPEEVGAAPPVLTELSTDDSDDEEESDQLIREIDAMKERLLGTMRSSIGQSTGIRVRDSISGQEPEVASLAALRQSTESQASFR